MKIICPNGAGAHDVVQVSPDFSMEHRDDFQARAVIVTFVHDGESVLRFVVSPEFAAAHAVLGGSYALPDEYPEWTKRVERVCAHCVSGGPPTPMSSRSGSTLEHIVGTANLDDVAPMAPDLTISERSAEVEVVDVHERGDFIYLLLRQLDGQIDVGHLLGAAGQSAEWRIVGFATMPGEAWAEGLRDITVVRWVEDAAVSLPRVGDRLVAARGPQKL
jgi:hypothetical protein